MKRLLFVFALGLVISAGFYAATTVTGIRQAIACDGGGDGGGGAGDNNGGK